MWQSKILQEATPVRCICLEGLNIGLRNVNRIKNHPNMDQEYVNNTNKLTAAINVQSYGSGYR
jgi:hypothetical protein